LEQVSEFLTGLNGVTRPIGGLTTQVVYAWASNRNSSDLMSQSALLSLAGQWLQLQLTVGGKAANPALK
jgi:hypothetical protein